MYPLRLLLTCVTQEEYRIHIVVYAGSIAFDAGEGWPGIGDTSSRDRVKSSSQDVLQSQR